MQDLVDLLAGRRVDLRAAEGAYWRSFAGRWRKRLSVWPRLPAPEVLGCLSLAAAVTDVHCDPALELCNWQGLAHIMLLAVLCVHTAWQVCHITSRCCCAMLA